jgi:uncharacterized repeat protein (TIGR03803 family)
MELKQGEAPIFDINLRTGIIPRVLAFIFAATIIAMPAHAQTLTVLHNFALDKDGASPGKGITMDQHGRFYGTTQYGGDLNCDGGGPPGCGVVFRLANPGSGWIYTPLLHFTTQYSAFPMDPGVPAIAPDGSLYDVTVFGGQYSNGMVFNLRRPSTTSPASMPSSWNFNSVYQFTGNNDGGGPSPVSPLLFDGQGNIYGAAGGGVYGDGVIYKLTPSGNGWTEGALHTFTGCDGAFPSGITFDSKGNMYGTTSAGGGPQCGYRDGCGTIFKLTPARSGWTETTLYDFQEGTDGCHSGPLFRDPAGNLYGITTEGGPDNNGGTVWELSPTNGGWSFSVLHAFNFFTVGYYGPYAPTMDAAGNIWGVVNWGGANETGMLFRLMPSNGVWKFSDVYDFAPRGGQGGGCYPNGTPVLGANGNLYGVTQLCGTFGEGTLWEFRP